MAYSNGILLGTATLILEVDLIEILIRFALLLRSKYIEPMSGSFTTFNKLFFSFV